MKAAYRRLLVKLSGEQLAGEGGFGISPTVIKRDRRRRCARCTSSASSSAS